MKDLTIGLLCSLLAASCFAGIVEDSGVNGGIVVQLGAESDQDLAELLVSDAYLVHVLDKDSARVDKARADLRDKGLYGKISVNQFAGTRLPYADNLINLLIDKGGTWQVTSDEVNRVLVPGGVAMIGGKKTVKPWPADMGTWTHYLHSPDNNAVTSDRIVAAPRSIQWVADPMWSRSHEQMASVSAAVSDAGRIFYIEDIAPRVSVRYMADWKLTCRDAFNGTLLWRRDIGQWSDHLRHFRAGPLHLTRRLVVDGDKLYVTMAIDAPVSVLDAVTGETIRVIEGTERTDEITVAQGIAYLVVGTSEKNRRGSNDSFYERGEPKATDYRFMTAIDLSHDKVLWKKEFSGSRYLLPLSMTVRGGSVYYQNLQGVGRLDAKTGNELWLTPRETVAVRMAFSAPTVVATDEVLLVADRNPSRRRPAAQAEEKKAGGENPRKRKEGSPEACAATAGVEWGIHGWNIDGIPRGNPSTLVAYSVEDGKELWRMNAQEIYNAPVDVFVIDNIVYVSGGWSGYDLKTGEMKVAMSRGAPVAMAHHRCYRNNASVNYIFTGRDGIEILDVKKGWQGNNSWIRGTCQYGIMPANGLLYTPPNACGCSSQVQLQGFFAASPRRQAQPPTQGLSRLVQGPAFGQIGNLKSEISNSFWPMFRANAKRSASVKTQIAADLKKAWSAKITDLRSTLTRSQLTQAIVVDGTVYVAVKDAHTVHALDADSGKEKWTYTTGSRIDSAPTYHKGMLICGSADGCVYCLRASDGALAWKFKAAPADMLVSVFGQLESAWPVHGSVLVHDEELVFMAGRSTYLDDGLRFYRLNPATGQVLAEKTITHIDPQTDKQTGKEPFREAGARAGFNIEGVTTDIMSSGDCLVYLKYMGFDKNGNEIKENKTDHLFSMTTMLAEEWYVRTYWFYGHEFGGGWGGWSYAGKFPSGRIMAFDVDGIFGYGRTVIGGGPTGHKADQYHLYKNGGWSDEQSPIVRAMVKAGDKVVAAGPVDLRKKSSRLLAYENEEEALASFKGEKGVVMRVVSAKDGTVLSEQEIDAVPAFDGMSAADGAVFIALKNGELQCWK